MLCYHDTFLANVLIDDPCDYIESPRKQMVAKIGMELPSQGSRHCLVFLVSIITFAKGPCQ